MHDWKFWGPRLADIIGFWKIVKHSLAAASQTTQGYVFYTIFADVASSSSPQNSHPQLNHGLIANHSTELLTNVVVHYN